MSFGFGFGFPRRAAAGGAAPSLNFDFTSLTSLPSRITFSRTSNATLTDSNGRVAYAPHNLLTNSEDYEASAWTKTNASITANAAVAPDGTTTADKLIEDATLNSHYTAQSVTTAAIPHSYSVYLKAAERSFVLLWSATANFGRVFNLSNGTVSGTVAGVPQAEATISDAGNGWYRCTIYGTCTAASNSFRAYTMTDATTFSYTGNGTSGIFIWGAQLNVAKAPVNLLTFSEQFDNAAWARTSINATGTPAWVNVTTAPDGTLTADKLIANLNNTDHVFSQATTSITSGSAYTLSAFFKGDASNQWVQLGGSSGAFGVNVWANFDVLNGVVGFVGSSTTATIEPASNGFFRCAVTGTATASTTGGLNIFLLNNTNTNARSPAFVGSNTDGVSAWGAQLNTGSTALPYVATTSSIYLPPSYNSTTPKNLLGFTQEFDNAAWVKANVTVLAKTIAAPDGTNTASTIVEDVSSSVVHRVRQPITPALSNSAFSVYVKPNGRTQAWIGKSDAAYVLFDLDAVTASTVNWPGVVNQITPLPNGWFRISVTNADFATTGVYVGTAVGGAISYIGDGTSGIYIWGAQLSNSASVDPYVYNPQAAPTSTAYYGPRFDYNPVTLAANGLLIEEQRTNLLTYSEDFSNAVWSAISAKNVVSNSAVAPDGTTTADTLSDNSSVAFEGITQGTTVSVGTQTYTASCYVRKTTGGTSATFGFNMSITGGTTVSVSPRLNTDTGLILGSSGAVQDAGNYWRFSASVTNNNTAGNTNLSLAIFPATGAHNSGTDVATATGSAIVWGAQLEAGSFATSYIPTVASQVTRAADNASMLGDNFATWYNQTQGTFVVGFSSQYSGSPGITPTQLAFTNLAGASGFISYWNGAVVSSFDGTSTASANIGVSSWVGPHKVASSYGGATKEICANAGTVGSSAYSGAWSAATGLKSAPSGWVRSISYYPTKLPSTTLQSITA